MRSVVLGLCAALTLAGCADPRVAQVQASKSTLVGMEKETLLACAGVPERSEATDNGEFLTYEAKQSYATPRYGFGLGFGHGFGYGFGGHHRHRHHHGGIGISSGIFLPLGVSERTVGCKATFSLKDNKVSRVTYGGVGDSSVRYNQCYYVVENCLNNQVAVQ